MGKKPTELKHILSQFLFRACVDFGFCLPPKIKESLVKEPTATATQFVNRVMIAEGLNPQHEKQHFGSLHGLLLEMIGSEHLSDFEKSAAS